MGRGQWGRGEKGRVRGLGGGNGEGKRGGGGKKGQEEGDFTDGYDGMPGWT